jgi:putative tricarboxylic transport membrane protein
MLKKPGYDVGSIVACVGFIVLGVFAFLATEDYSDLGSVFPQTISGLIVVLAVVYIILSIRKPRGAPEQAGGSRGRQLAVAVVMVGWAFTLQPIGFLTSSAIAFVLLLMVGHYGSWSSRLAILYAGAAFLVLGSLYLLFAVVLQVPLPEGMLL